MFIFIFLPFDLSRSDLKSDYSLDLTDNNLVTPHMTLTIRSIMLKEKAKKIVICWN